MAPCKSPSVDGFISEFYTKYWHLIGEDFTSMIHQSIAREFLPQGMNRGTIALLCKEGSREEIDNWRPINLLNVAYKILVKLFWRCLHPLLAEVISPDQMAFIPTRH